jgi:hypothetical protein
MASSDYMPTQCVGNNLWQQVELLARQLTPEVIARLEQLVQRDEAWIMRPALEGVCNYADLINGTLDLVDVERLNRALDVRDQQRAETRQREQAELARTIIAALSAGRAEVPAIDGGKETGAGAGDTKEATAPSETTLPARQNRRRPDNTKRGEVEIWFAEERRMPDFVVPSMSELSNLKRRYRNSRRGKKSNISDKHLLRILKGILEELYHDQLPTAE